MAPLTNALVFSFIEAFSIQELIGYGQTFRFSIDYLVQTTVLFMLLSVWFIHMKILVQCVPRKGFRTADCVQCRVFDKNPKTVFWNERKEVKMWISLRFSREKRSGSCRKNSRISWKTNFEDKWHFTRFFFAENEVKIVAKNRKSHEKRILRTNGIRQGFF